MRRVLIALIAVLAFSGCANEPSYRHAEGADYYYGERSTASAYVPDYIAYDAYYSALWPTYHYWYNPYFASHFYYGVTWYPTNFFGFGGGYGWPYWGYSPYYTSYWDGYYDWRYWDERRAREIRAQRFGNMRNERAAIAQMNRSDARISAQRANAVSLPGAAASSRRTDTANTVDAPTARGERGSDRDMRLPARDRAGRDQAGQLPTSRVDRDVPDPYYGTPRSERRPEWRSTRTSATPAGRTEMMPREDEFRDSPRGPQRLAPTGDRAAMPRERAAPIGVPSAPPTVRQAPALRGDSTPSMRSAPSSAPSSRSSERSDDKR